MVIAAFRMIFRESGYVFIPSPSPMIPRPGENFLSAERDLMNHAELPDVLLSHMHCRCRDPPMRVYFTGFRPFCNAQS